MNNLSGLTVTITIVLFILLLITLTVKVILFFKHERDWDPIRFFHFSKIDLKMTPIKQLRVRRKQQNLFTRILVILLALLVFTFVFKALISS